jgi:ADP-ribose pyrophosphatase YjhB (NUDIX family)
MTAFPKCWVFPGGMVDKGDPLEWEVLRELEEEVGINTDGILDTITPIVLYGTL